MIAVGNVFVLFLATKHTAEHSVCIVFVCFILISDNCTDKVKQHSKWADLEANSHLWTCSFVLSAARHSNHPKFDDERIKVLISGLHLDNKWHQTAVK